MSRVEFTRRQDGKRKATFWVSIHLDRHDLTLAVALARFHARKRPWSRSAVVTQAKKTAESYGHSDLWPDVGADNFNEASKIISKLFPELEQDK